jgi:7-cyano-7-deazaguanine tRNA-ribosyltransferase
MNFSFEVDETDLLGRTGKLRVDGKTLGTPYMFPVVHPVNQPIGPDELKSMGFGGLMTNAYILHARRREEALSKGIHDLLGFGGILMTDSGGYQVLEYGDLGLGYKETAKFQADIGSDLAVTLDRPTGYPQSRPRALETVDYSLKNAVLTRKQFVERKTVWVGPIQGGLYFDLVKKSTKSMVGASFEFLALGSPVQVMESYKFADLVRMILAARSAMPYSIPLHLFGAGHPLTMALAVALGCDTFDSASYIIFARTGRYMTRSGVTALAAMKHLPCSCGVCVKSSVEGLLELEPKERTRLLATHNLFILREELEACKQAIVEGRLWDLVQEKSMAHPRLREAFVEFARHTKEMVDGTPALKERGLFVRSKEDLQRPEIVQAAARLNGSYHRSSGKALLLEKEEGNRGSHFRSKKSLDDADVYFVHPVLGLYPAELEFAYPLSQTEVGAMEPIVSLMNPKKKLRRLGYTTVTVVEGGRGLRQAVKSKRTRRGASPSPPSS